VDVAAALGELLGAPVDSLERRPFEYQTSHAIDELDLWLADRRFVHMLLKNLGAPSETALNTKPFFLGDPLREIEVYADVLDGRDLGTAHCFGAVGEPERGRYWLFIEHVPGIPLWQVSEIATWQNVARWLAGLHTNLQNVDDGHLVHYDRRLYETWLDRACAGRGGPSLKGLASGYDMIVGRLLDIPTSFLHGEFYPSNVLIDRREERTRICPIDWEMAAVGPGLLDLAALTSGGWSHAERDSMVLAYYEALPSPPPFAEFLEQLECCRLQIALQWLGWASDDWQPPTEHVQDWLSEVLRAGRVLGVA
jgi:hypothetical protein